jgi:uncharacterized membrane protein (UPF0127 family)
LVFAVLVFTSLSTPGAAQEGLAVFERDSLVVRTAEGAEHGFEIELALSAAQQAQGLMYRPSLAAEAGMLFVYRPARDVRMWMRNTAIPLDMLFVSESGKIVKIVERTVPYSLAIIASGRPVRGVIELNGGTAARLGLRPGDQVLHPAFDTEG